MRVTAESLRSFRLFHGTTADAIADLALASRRSTAAAGALVFEAGSPAISVVLVLAGLVRVVRRSREGTASTLGLFGPRDVIGLSAALEGSTYPADAEVVSKAATVARVPAPQLRRLAETDANMLRGINEALLEHTRILRAKIDVMTAADVEQRLARLLVHLLDRFGDDLEDGSAMLPLDLQRRQLAELVGARVETVIRAMRRWAAEGLVTSAKGRLCVANPSALAARAASQQP